LSTSTKNQKKTVVVTGASRGLGLAICTELLKENYFVVAISRTMSDELSRLCEAQQQSIAYKPYDLADLDGIHTLCKSITDAYGRPYALVNNAAVGFDGVLATMHNSEISTLLNINVQAPILLSKYLSRSMMLNRTGRIINISSIDGLQAKNSLSAYASSKWGMRGLTKSAALEFGKYGIRVNTVHPGGINTSMGDQEAIEGDELNVFYQNQAIPRVGTPSEVARMSLFLASDDASYSTGSEFKVDGGWNGGLILDFLPSS